MASTSRTYLEDDVSIGEDDAIEVPPASVSKCRADQNEEVVVVAPTKSTLKVSSVKAAPKAKFVADEDMSVGEDDDIFVDKVLEAEEDGTGALVASTSRSIHRSAHSSGMDSSVLRFKNVNFLVGKKGEERHLLTDVSGTVRWGRE